MKKKLALTICTACTLCGMAYEWSEKDDERLLKIFGEGMLADDVMYQGMPPLPPYKPPVRKFIELSCPDMTDSEMVGHLTGVIDRLLEMARTRVMVEKGKTREVASIVVLGSTSFLLPSLCVLDNPDAAEQLEHYLSVVTRDEVLREKIREETTVNRHSKVPGVIDGFQRTALENLLPLLDAERRIALAENVVTNELLYGVSTMRLAQGVLAELIGQEGENETPPKEENEKTSSVAEEAPPVVAGEARQPNAETATADTATEPTATKSAPSKRWVLFGLGVIVLGGVIYAWRKGGR